VRFDYLGCGDSADIDPTANQISIWVDDVLSAVAELRRQTGVKDVCLLGIRLGALLALLAAARGSDIQGLVLVAPIVSGKRYVRELRTARLAALSGQHGQDAVQVASGIEAALPGLMEFSGYAMSEASMKSLAALDLAGLGVPPMTRVLVIDRDDLPAARSWSTTLAGSGIDMEYVPLPGFVEMALVAPQFAIAPLAMIATMLTWLAQFRDGNEQQVELLIPASRTDIVRESNVRLRLPGDLSSDENDLTECPVFMGSDAALFGIITKPCEREVRRRGVLLLNAGADYHMGPSRMYVSLARQWGRRGYYVLRLDLAGLGDSGLRSGRPPNEMFPPAALEDIRAAIAFIREQYDLREITLAGLCSGAYHALRAAAAGIPVDRILLVNPQNYFWTEGTTLNDLQIAEVIRNPGVYKERIQSATAWKRVLSGEVDVWKIVKIYAYREKLALESRLRDIARFLRIRLPNDLGWELEGIVERGVRIAFIFARGEPGIDLLKIQGGSSLRKLGDRCRIRIVECADHTFSLSGARSVMERILSDELFVRRLEPVSVWTKASEGDFRSDGNCG
jgi:pimeloyl-ACP methyl ester carboxylesterase